MSMFDLTCQARQATEKSHAKANKLNVRKASTSILSPCHTTRLNVVKNIVKPTT